MKKTLHILYYTIISILIPLPCLSVSPQKGNILFIDEFNENSIISDSSIWKLCTYGNHTWGQHFKNVEGYENVKVENGVLKLKVSKDKNSYKNGGIRTTSGFPCNTRLEVKAKLTKLVKGGFPAIWQMPMDAPQWPRGGEIDLMEWVQGTPNDIYQTVHTYFINGDNGSAGATNPNRPTNFDITQYHVYAADRTEEAIIFYIDGKETWRYPNQHLPEEKMQYPFCQYKYDIILNFSLGGDLNGNPTWPGKINDDDLPGEMWIDWVKVSSL